MIRRTKFYLDKRNAKLLGVCSGIADYFGLDALWVRVGTVLLVVFGSGGLLTIAYLAVGLLAERKPERLYDMSDDEQHFWRDMRTAPRRGLQDVRTRFRSIDRRLRDVEAHVTSSGRNLAAEIDRLK